MSNGFGEMIFLIFTIFFFIWIFDITNHLQSCRDSLEPVSVAVNSNNDLRFAASKECAFDAHGAIVVIDGAQWLQCTCDHEQS